MINLMGKTSIVSWTMYSLCFIPLNIYVFITWQGLGIKSKGFVISRQYASINVLHNSDSPLPDKTSSK